MLQNERFIAQKFTRDETAKGFDKKRLKAFQRAQIPSGQADIL